MPGSPNEVSEIDVILSSAADPDDEVIPPRMVAQSAKIEAGHIYLPKDAPWLATFLRELLAFPNGANDDQVDSVSQLLIWMQQVVRQPIPIVPPYVVSRPRNFPG